MCLKLPAEGRVARLGTHVGCQLVEVHPLENLSVGAVRGFYRGSSRVLSWFDRASATVPQRIMSMALMFEPSI